MTLAHLWLKAEICPQEILFDPEHEALHAASMGIPEVVWLCAYCHLALRPDNYLSNCESSVPHGLRLFDIEPILEVIPEVVIGG